MDIEKRIKQIQDEIRMKQCELKMLKSTLPVKEAKEKKPSFNPKRIQDMGARIIESLEEANDNELISDDEMEGYLMSIYEVFREYLNCEFDSGLCRQDCDDFRCNCVFEEPEEGEELEELSE